MFELNKCLKFQEIFFLFYSILYQWETAPPPPPQCLGLNQQICSVSVLKRFRLAGPISSPMAEPNMASLSLKAFFDKSRRLTSAPLFSRLVEEHEKMSTLDFSVGFSVGPLPTV